MVRPIFNLIILGLAFFMISCENPNGTPAETNTCLAFAKNDVGLSMKWTSALPIKLWIDPSVPETSRAAISDAAEEWNKQMKRTFFEVDGVSPSLSTAVTDGKNVIYWMTTWNEKSDLQAHSILRWREGGIFEADMLINAKDISFDLQSLVTHELGHFLGLAHFEKSTSVMQTYLPSGTIRRTLSPDDVAHINCAYKRP